MSNTKRTGQTALYERLSRDDEMQEKAIPLPIKSNYLKVMPKETALQISITIPMTELAEQPLIERDFKR